MLNNRCVPIIRTHLIVILSLAVFNMWFRNERTNKVIPGVGFGFAKFDVWGKQIFLSSFAPPLQQLHSPNMQEGAARRCTHLRSGAFSLPTYSLHSPSFTRPPHSMIIHTQQAGVVLLPSESASAMNRQTDKRTNGKTDNWQTEKQTKRQTEKQTNRLVLSCGPPRVHWL